MIAPSSFLLELEQIDITNYYGIPDSTLKNFCSYLSAELPKAQHTICVNEGVAVAAAVGYHLATGKTPLVYMQNSGLGNSVNPLASLVAKEIYSIPLLLLVGWRGEPNVQDEPQHILQGRITRQLFEILEIPYTVVDSDSDIESIVKQAGKFFQKEKSPYALLVRKGTFAKALNSPVQVDNKVIYSITREEAIRTIVDSLETDTIIVSTTGMASRELFEIREINQQSHSVDFLTVGGMGCASSIALGIAMQHPKKQVICLDGDGAVLMHMGAMGTIGSIAPDNLLHIVINNGEHGSTGGQPTISRDIDLCGVARACNYKDVFRVSNLAGLTSSLQEKKGGLCFLEVMVNNSCRDNVGRPTSTPVENKVAFMRSFAT